MNPIGCNSDQLSNILSFCGYANVSLGDDKQIFFQKPKDQVMLNKKSIKKKGKKGKKSQMVKKVSKNKKENKIDPDSPFAVLQKLL